MTSMFDSGPALESLREAHVAHHALAQHTGSLAAGNIVDGFLFDDTSERHVVPEEVVPDLLAGLGRCYAEHPDSRLVKLGKVVPVLGNYVSSHRDRSGELLVSLQKNRRL